MAELAEARERIAELETMYEASQGALREAMGELRQIATILGGEEPQKSAVDLAEVARLALDLNETLQRQQSDPWRRMVGHLRDRLAKTQRQANEYRHEYKAAVMFYVPKIAAAQTERHDLRADRDRLKAELAECQQQKGNWSDACELLEGRLAQERAKVMELQRAILEISPPGSIRAALAEPDEAEFRDAVAAYRKATGEHGV